MEGLIQRFQDAAAQLDVVVFGHLNTTFSALPKPIVGLIALVSVLAAIILSQRIVRGLSTRAAPVFEGIPLIGGMIKFARGPMLLMADGYKQCGEVFTVPLLHKNVTFLIGPATAPHFFKANDDEMSQTEVYKFNVPTFGPGVVFDVDVKIRTEQIRFFAESLKSQKLKNYVPQFVMEAEAFFATWGDEGVVDLQEQLSDLIILTASRTLLGREVREQLFDQVKDLLHDLDMGMQPISVLFPYLPTSFHRKRDSSRKKLLQLFSGVIQQRRKSGVKEDDVLQVFIDSHYRSAYGGRATTDEEISGFLIATLFAGQHTSSITSSWTGFCMLTNKDATLAPAEEEQRQILAKHGSELNMDVLNEMEVLQRNIQEALRLFPPLIMLMRYAKEPFSVTTSKGKEYTIPKGTIVATSPAFAHRLPNVYSDPTAYQPDRYLPPRAEDKVAPFSYIGFGGGRHACLGQNFAYLQIKTVWSVLLRNFELEMVDPFPEPNYESMVVGPKPCRVHFKRRKLV